MIESGRPIPESAWFHPGAKVVVGGRCVWSVRPNPFAADTVCESAGHVWLRKEYPSGVLLCRPHLEQAIRLALVPRTVREPVRHELKTAPEFIPWVLEGLKTFEIRRDDRDYRVGDSLELKPWTAEKGFMLGLAPVVYVRYILRDVPAFGLRRGFCIMSWNRAGSCYGR